MIKISKTNLRLLSFTKSMLCRAISTSSVHSYPLAGQLRNGLGTLLKRNRDWAEKKHLTQPELFPSLASSQAPKILWIGCSDSRIPETEIFGADPGDFFVHRNVANLIRPDDLNLTAALEYAVGTLKVQHIILCGHYGCGGVQAALQGMGSKTPPSSPLEAWIQPLAKLCKGIESNQAWRRLVHYNVLQGTRTIMNHPLVKENKVQVHPWVYDVASGLIHLPEDYLTDESLRQDGSLEFATASS